jgi:probable O-glycosylation ligase (exosortase A-associated)
MRDVIVLAIVLGSVPVCLVSPYIGILMWSWVAYFNPHRFTYGAAYNFPVAQVIAIPTLIGALFNQDRNRRILVRETVLILMLWTWFLVSYLNATVTAEFARNALLYGKPQLITVSKVLLMTMMTILLVNSKQKLRYLFLLTAFCFGVLGTKGALFGFRTAGEQRVWGPPDSFVADNNFLALATNMCIPIFYYLSRYEKNRRLRLAMRFMFVCSIVSVLLSYSRGALLGLSVVLAAIAVRSRYKVLSVILVLITCTTVLTFAPEKWTDRMGNFVHGKLDNSAEKRLNAWQFAFMLAKNHPLAGGGFETFTPALFEKYLPGYEFAGPHSCYFQVMGEHGFVGFGLFVALLISCWLSLMKLSRTAKLVPTLEWVLPYSHMLQVALLGFMITGAFLACAYFDLFYQLCAGTIILKILSRSELIRLAHEESLASDGPVAEPEMPWVSQPV